MYISIDIGGTTTRLASSENLSKPIIVNRKNILTSDNFDQNYQNILNYLDSKTQIEGIGISIPGVLNDDKSTVISIAHNIPGYRHSPLKSLLVKRYKCPVQMENDAVAAALGEAVYGNGNGVNFVYITWGTGIGGASVNYSNDKPKVSQLDWDKYLSDWENTCGGKNIEKEYIKAAAQLTENEWSSVMAQFQKEFSSFLSKLDTQRVIFGGGVSIKQSARLQNLTKQPNFNEIKIEISGLGEDTGLLGALALIKYL